jgi:ABC-type transport system substrate-binding protein
MVLALGGLVLSGCVDKRPPEELESSVIYGYSDTIATFDPAKQRYAQESSVFRQVMEGLVEWDNDLQLAPLLATKWETPDDCKTWYFHLREGVKFHDGTPFNADVVKWHFERIKDPATASTRAYLIQDLDWIEVLDDHLVAFHMKTPNCVLPELFAGTWARFPSRKNFDELGEGIARNPVGTGPFRFVEWRDDIHIKFERNPDYWNPDIYHLERLEFRPIKEHTTRLILLEQGTIDIASLFYKHSEVAAKIPGVELQSVPQLSIRYVGFNVNEPPFDNVLMRRAANHAINKDDMVKYVLMGAGTPAKGPFPEVVSGYNPNLPVYDYDPVKAKAMIAEAGYPNGVDVELWTQEVGQYRDVAEAIIGDLEKVGIRVELKIFDNAAYWDKIDEFRDPEERSVYRRPPGLKPYNMYLGGWVGGETAHGYLRPLFLSTSTSNSSWYSNPEVDKLLDEYALKVTPAEREVIYRRIQEIVVEDAPWIFAYYGQIVEGVRDRVKGYRANPSNMYFFHDVTTDDGGEGAARMEGGRP